MASPARKARRITADTTTEKASGNIRLAPEAHRQLTAAAQKLKLSKSNYASAAIAFFAESGLNPTAERAQGLNEVGFKVSAETLAVRRQNVDIGNRLISILRNWEASLYGFLQQQEIARNLYLSEIERSILQRVVALEANLMGPVVEQALKGTVEAYAARIVAERTYLHVMGKPPTDWDAQHASLNRERDQLLLTALQDFVKENPDVKTTLTTKPLITPVPARPIARTSEATPAQT